MKPMQTPAYIYNIIQYIHSLLKSYFVGIKLQMNHLKIPQIKLSNIVCHVDIAEISCLLHSYIILTGEIHAGTLVKDVCYIAEILVSCLFNSYNNDHQSCMHKGTAQGCWLTLLVLVSAQSQCTIRWQSWWLSSSGGRHIVMEDSHMTIMWLSSITIWRPP